MATKPRTVDIAEVSDFAALVDEVNRTQLPCLVQRDGQDVALLSPVKAKTVARQSRKAASGKPKSTLLDLIGIGEGDVEGGISERKHEALLEAHYRHHNTP